MPDPQPDLLDLDSLLDDDERAVRDSVAAACAEHVVPHVAGWFEAGHVEHGLVRELAREFGRLGLLGMHLEGYGCAGMSAVDYGLACTELEAVDSGVRSLVSVQGSLAMHAIHAYGSEEQRQGWLPGMASGETIGCFGLTEPDHGSDPGSMTTRARRDGTDWVLDGAKTWITNAPLADVAVVWARTEDGIRGFVVPTSTTGVSTPTIERKMSLRASVTGEVVLEGVRLPQDAVLPGVRGLKGPLSCLSEARYGIVWGSMGAARSALTTALAYAAAREQFDRPISAFQLTQAKLARMHQSWATGMLLALHLGRLKDRSGLRPEQVSVGKLNNVGAALEVCRTARTILGANGVSGDYPLMRHMANLESVLTYEGTEEMHTLVVGQALTGQQAYR